MPIAPGLLEQIAAQLASLPALAIRRMFGGAGLYSSGVFFGVVDDDRVYLRIGDGNRDDFKRAGSVAFQPIPDKPAMAYFSVPTMVIARSERFVEWAKKAVDAARAAKATTPKRTKPATVTKTALPASAPKKSATSAKRTTAPAKNAASAKKKAVPAKKAVAKRRR